MAEGDKTEATHRDAAAPLDAAGLARALHRITRKLAHSRSLLAAARTSEQGERSVAQQRLLEAQDLQAAVFRLREQLRMARLDADEAHGQRVDIESELHREQARVVELQADLQDVGNQLRQVLATHAQDTAAWQAELERVHAAHERDTAAWQAEVARVRSAHEHDNAVWQGEVERLRGELAQRIEESSRQSEHLSREVQHLEASLAAARRPAGALRVLRGALMGRLSPARAPDTDDATRRRD